jgi:hypothetical protein
MPDEDLEHPGVAKVKAMWERGEFEKIDEMVRLWTAIQNVGLLGGLLKKFIIWSGVVAAGYLALNGHITEWVRSIK